MKTLELYRNDIFEGVFTSKAEIAEYLGLENEQVADIINERFEHLPKWAKKFFVIDSTDEQDELGLFKDLDQDDMKEDDSYNAWLESQKSQ